MTFFSEIASCFFEWLRSLFFLGGGDILQADNIFFEWLSQGAEIFFDCLKCFRRVAISSGEGCRDYQEG